MANITLNIEHCCAVMTLINQAHFSEWRIWRRLQDRSQSSIPSEKEKSAIRNPSYPSTCVDKPSSWFAYTRHYKGYDWWSWMWRWRGQFCMCTSGKLQIYGLWSRLLTGTRYHEAHSWYPLHSLYPPLPEQLWNSRLFVYMWYKLHSSIICTKFKQVDFIKISQYHFLGCTLLRNERRYTRMLWKWTLAFIIAWTTAQKVELTSQKKANDEQGLRSFFDPYLQNVVAPDQLLTRIGKSLKDVWFL